MAARWVSPACTLPRTVISSIRIYGTCSSGAFRWTFGSKRQRDYPADGGPFTTLIEFGRGSEHGGWKQAFRNLGRETVEKAAILYVNVSYAESLRKNRQRFNPLQPDGILEHGLSDEKMERTCGRDSDWDVVSGGAKAGRIEIQGVGAPFVVFENEDDVTTPGGEALGRRLESRLVKLWDDCIK